MLSMGCPSIEGIGTATDSAKCSAVLSGVFGRRPLCKLEVFSAFHQCYWLPAGLWLPFLPVTLAWASATLNSANVSSYACGSAADSQP